MHDMDIVGIRPELAGSVPVVLLREREGRRRHLPIFIGQPESVAIQLAIEGRSTPRPMTHDLMKDVLTTLGVVLEEIRITSLVDGVFFAELHLRSGADLHVVSGRPSDAIALAVRMDVPVRCAPEVLDEAGVEVDDEDDDHEPSEDVLDEFRQFIESVNPEDFES